MKRLPAPFIALMVLGTIGITSIWLNQIPKGTGSTGGSSAEDSEPSAPPPTVAAQTSEKPSEAPTPEVKSAEPNSHWYNMRYVPGKGLDLEEYLKRMGRAAIQKRNAAKRGGNLSMAWQLEGPNNIGGRINVLTLSPGRPDTIYAGAANGGVYRSMDGGGSWDPIFDGQPYMPVGAIAVDPQDDQTIYVGTGDRNFGGGSFIGSGLYRSTDFGSNWTQVGLQDVGIISECFVHPSNSDVIWVAAQGNCFQKDNDRGIYKTTDGGTNWTQVLFVSDSSGVTDLTVDPTNPNRLYAASFNRMNLYERSLVRGPDANVYRSVDGGDTWTECTNGLPFNQEHSRVGVAVSAANPNRVYALYVDTTQYFEDIYVSNDFGASWNALNCVGSGVPFLPDVGAGGFGWYFGQIFVSPTDEDHLVVPGVDMFESFDGGNTWVQNVPDWWTYDVHADKHALQFITDNNYIIGTDGGIYETNDYGANWFDIDDIPVTQFYHVTTETFIPGEYAGGAQDNGTTQGSLASGLNNWARLFGGDGFKPVFVDPALQTAFYETQRGGLYFFDGSNYEYLNPVSANPTFVNWDMPYDYSHGDQMLLAGADMVYRQYGPVFNEFNYIPVSNNLTLLAQGPVNEPMSRHNISTISRSRVHTETVLAGTSDGLLWKCDNISAGSPTWTDISAGLPELYVTSAAVSVHNSSHYFATMQGYYPTIDTAYVFKSEDGGNTWIDISGNLPGVGVNDIYVLDTYQDARMFVGTDIGVYYTSDSGATWDVVGNNLPNTTCADIDIDEASGTLIVGTYSRSMWSYDVSWAIPEPTPGVAEHLVQTKVYPNPTTGRITLDGWNNGQIAVYDLQGRFVQNLYLWFNQVDLNHLSSGNYILKSEKRCARVTVQ